MKTTRETSSLGYICFLFLVGAATYWLFYGIDFNNLF